MPIVEIPIPNSIQKTYYHEPNQRFNSIDLNRISGAFNQDSMLMSILLALRGMGGVFGNSPTYQPYGFKIASYNVSNITINPGILISNSAIYYYEGGILTPTPESHYGIYELEIVDETGNPVMKSFLDTIPQTFSAQLGDSRKIFRLKLYENYNTTPVFPSLTPGRLELITYKKSASLGSIIQASNVLGKSSGTTGFQTGDIKPAVSQADGTNWLNCDGSTIPANHTDLIDLLRSCRVNASTILFASISNNGSGFCRLNFMAQNLKNVNLFPHPDSRHTTIELVTSSNPSFPAGTYRIIGTDSSAGLWIDILLAYPGGTSTGNCEIRPFSKADIDGGGARTPVITYLKNHLSSDPQDVNRLPFTYQRSKNARHSHGSTNLSIIGSPQLTGTINVSGTGSATLDNPYIPEGGVSTPNPGPYIVASDLGDDIARAVSFNSDITVNVTFTSTSTLAVNAGTLDVGGSTDQAEGTISDTDNPNVARPENFTVYYQIKT